MGVINRIELNSIEDLIKEIISISSQIKLIQDEAEDVLVHLEENKRLFSEGKISKDVFKDNKQRLKSEIAELKKRFNQEAEKISKVIEDLKKILESNKI